MKWLPTLVLFMVVALACNNKEASEQTTEVVEEDTTQYYDSLGNKLKEDPLPGEIERPNLPKPQCTEYTGNALRYLFLGHTYHWHTPGDRIDWRLEMMNLDCFDQIWLGGDVCSETAKKKSTVEYIDSIFDVGKPGNFWALGNHDIRNGNLDWIKEKTGRDTYYTERLHGMTVVVLNTHFPQIYKDDSVKMCEEGKKQFDFLMSVLDTVSEKSSHLVLLMHHVLWRAAHIDKKFWNYANYTRKDWRFYCDSNATFDSLVYPKLVEIKNKGIEVVLLAGDCGVRDWGYNMKYRNFTTKAGIHILASGINNSRYPDRKQRERMWKDKVLLFYHDTGQQKLTWQFHDFDSLVEKQMQSVKPGFQL